MLNSLLYFSHKILLCCCSHIIRVLHIGMLKFKCPLPALKRKLEIVKDTVGDRGSTVVKVLRYKPESRRFDSTWYHWNFSLT